MLPWTEPAQTGKEQPGPLTDAFTDNGVIRSSKPIVFASVLNKRSAFRPGFSKKRPAIMDGYTSGSHPCVARMRHDPFARLTRQVAIFHEVAGLLLDQAQAEQRRQPLQCRNGRAAQLALDSIRVNAKQSTSVLRCNAQCADAVS